MTDILKLFLQVSVMASVMIGVVLVIRRIYSDKMSPAVMLVLWGLVMLRLLLPFTLTSPISFAELLPEQSAVSQIQETAASNEAPSAAFDAAHTVADADNTKTADGSTAAAVNDITYSETQKPQNEKPLIDALKALPLWGVLAAVWMAGIAATLCLSISKAVRFKRKLRFCRAVTDDALLKMIRYHQKSVGIKKTIRVLDCDLVSAPAVFGYFKPCILIPSRFACEMDRDSLGAILLHEIYHIRCHDILTNYIWLAAKALHWFNPLVWLAYKWFQDDVEVRRDEKAARMLNKGGTLKYSESLLAAARFSKQTTHMPLSTAALFENKRKLRNRVLRLIKPQKKTKSAAAVSAVLALVMVIACFTTACQPTPEVEVVVGRQEDVLESVQTVEPDDFEPIEVPEHVSEVYDDYPYLSITYDADVIVPETSAYPITEMSEKVFTEEDKLSFIDLFIDGDYEMYAGWPLTKDDYLSLLTKAKEYEGTERVTDSQLQYLQELYEKATNDVEDTQISSLAEIQEYRPLNIKNEDNIISRFMFEPNGLAYCRGRQLYGGCAVQHDGRQPV